MQTNPQVDITHAVLDIRFLQEALRKIKPHSPEHSNLTTSIKQLYAELSSLSEADKKKSIEAAQHHISALFARIEDPIVEAHFYITIALVFIEQHEQAHRVTTPAHINRSWVTPRNVVKWQTISGLKFPNPKTIPIAVEYLFFNALNSTKKCDRTKLSAEQQQALDQQVTQIVDLYIEHCLLNMGFTKALLRRRDKDTRNKPNYSLRQEICNTLRSAGITRSFATKYAKSNLNTHLINEFKAKLRPELITIFNNTRNISARPSKTAAAVIEECITRMFNQNSQKKEDLGLTNATLLWNILLFDISHMMAIANYDYAADQPAGSQSSSVAAGGVFGGDQSMSSTAANVTQVP